jgi:hypothetical protein
MAVIKINNDCSLKYWGSQSLEEPAKQIAAIIDAAYKKNGVGHAGRNWSEFPPIQITITYQGGIEIGNMHKPQVDFTTGMGIVTGSLLGIGMAKGKNPVVDARGVDGDVMSPCCAAVRFKSFADLAECANVLAKSQEMKVDVVALPRTTAR